MIRNIAILGYSECKPGDELYQSAFEVSKALAESGYTIVNGGGPGVMKASTEGARAGGGKAIGVYFNPRGMINFEGRDPSNPVSEKMVLPNYVERTLKLLDLGDVYIIFNGGTGTISEFGMAWGLARLYFGYHKPLILYGEFWHSILEAIAEKMLIREEELKVYRIVTKPEDVLIAVREMAAE
ncbi:MAG: LOG family protein [bacterium]|nr:LOG family protein [bacterium]